MHPNRRTWTRSLLGALLITAVLVAIAGAPATATTTKAVKQIRIKNYTFTPKTITVAKGTKVTWTNMEAVTHTVTSTKSIATTTAVTKMFNATLNKGQTFSYTFKKKGIFFYECMIHSYMPSMHGKVIVK
jgi:plastocyanin